MHAAYDAQNEKDFAERLMARCTVEELKMFDRVLQVYSDILEQNLNAAR